MKRFAKLLAGIMIAAAALILVPATALAAPDLSITITFSPEGPYNVGDEYVTSVSIENTGDVTFATVEWDYFIGDHQMAQPDIQLTGINPGDTRSLTAFTSTIGAASAGQTLTFKVVVTAVTSGGETKTFTASKEYSVYVGAPATPDMQDCTFDISWSSRVYSGTSQVPTLTVKDGSTTLQEGVDYSVAIVGEDLETLTEAVDAGCYHFKITGMGAYEGTGFKAFNIERRQVGFMVDDETLDWTGGVLYGKTDWHIDYGLYGLVSGHTATVTYTPASGTDPDTYDNGSFADDLTILDGAGNDVTSNYEPIFQAGKLTIQAPPAPTGPEITQQPVDATVDQDALTYFRVEATGMGTITYQWLYRTSESGEPTAMSDGADWYDTGKETLMVYGRAAFDGYQFACAVIDDFGTVRTDWATLHVQEPAATYELSIEFIFEFGRYAFGDNVKGLIRYTWSGTGEIEFDITDGLTGGSWSYVGSEGSGHAANFKYSVTYADVEAGVISTSGTVTATGPNGEDIKITVTDATATVVATPAVIILDLGEGTLDGQTGTITIDANVGQTIQLPSGTPTLEGYTFKYWQGSEYYPGDDYTVEGDHTLKAVFEKNAPTIPATGDVTPLGLVLGLALLAASACGLAFAFARGRTRTRG